MSGLLRWCGWEMCGLRSSSKSPGPDVLEETREEVSPAVPVDIG